VKRPQHSQAPELQSSKLGHYWELKLVGNAVNDRCVLTSVDQKGGPEVRRLLFNAAMQARRNPLWEPYYLALSEQGFSTTAAFVALGRKLARVAFALLQRNVDFDANLHMAG
jgi:hypothetical protein